MNASRTRALLFFLFCWLSPGGGASVAEGAKPVVPLLMDLDRRVEKKDLPRGTVLRFVTEEDYPPFNYIGRDGQLTGFNVDLARAICAELNVACTVQPRQWSLLLAALDKGEAEAVIGSHRLNADLRRAYEVSLPTFRAPARFVVRTAEAGVKPDVASLKGKTVGVIGGTAHEAFLNTLFPGLRLSRFEATDAALAALKAREVDLVFGDGVALAFWLNGAQAQACCAFLDGAFTESRYFGEGSVIVFRPNAVLLRQAVDYALWRLNREGRYARLYLKHFPVSPW